MPSAVLNCSNRADREKCFPSNVKNNGKKVLKHTKVRKEKSLAQIFRKDLTERMLERTRIKIMLSASPSSVFSDKVQSIRFEKQKRILSSN